MTRGYFYIIVFDLIFQNKCTVLLYALIYVPFYMYFLDQYAFSASYFIPHTELKRATGDFESF